MCDYFSVGFWALRDGVPDIKDVIDKLLPLREVKKEIDGCVYWRTKKNDVILGPVHSTSQKKRSAVILDLCLLWWHRFRKALFFKIFSLYSTLKEFENATITVHFGSVRLR